MYLGFVERLKKPITDESNDKAHIDESQPVMIRYIAANPDHAFMLDKMVKLEDSYTHSLFQKIAADAAAQPSPDAESPSPDSPAKDSKDTKESKESKGKDDADEKDTKEGKGSKDPKEGGEPKEQKEVVDPKVRRAEKERAREQAEKEAEEKNIKMTLIKDVIRDGKIKFFKVPRLGCYVAVSIRHPCCVSEQSLDKAFDSYLEVLKKRAEQEKANQLKQEEMQKEKEDKEAAGEEYKETPLVWEEFEEPAYECRDESYYLCLDTLGQDREFSEAEKSLCLDLIRHYAHCWIQAERHTLTTDKELRFTCKKRDEEFKAKEGVEIGEEIEKTGEELREDEKL